MYDLGYADGSHIYGSNYKSMEYFVHKHTELAGAGLCDHLHEGLGFLTNHVALSLEFERALQVINPVIALPYWDYTIDAHAAIMADTGIAGWRNSDMFSDEWFGTTSPSYTQHTMETGIFAFLPVPLASDYEMSESSVSNAYGYLRSPWNTNNDP